MSRNIFTLSLFELKHEGCWSNLTSDYGVIIRTLYAKPKGDKYILGIDEIKANTIKEFKEFLRSFRNDENIIEIIDIREIDRRRGIFRIIFKETFNNKIMGILNNYSVIYLRDLIRNGEEKVLVILPKDEVNDLRREVEGLGSIKRFYESDVNFDSFIPSVMDLSEQERRTIIEAISKGYYDYPRKINLEELGEILNLSKPTLQEYLRKAEKKIMNKILSELKEFELLWND